jgi:hypothetical protein
MFTELYYWLYRTIKKNKFNKEPELSAYFLLSSFQGMNIVTLLAFANYFLDIFISKEIVVICAPILFLSILVINYLYLYRKRNEIIKKLEEFSTKRRATGKIFFIIYILATLFLLFYVITNFVLIRY